MVVVVLCSAQFIAALLLFFNAQCATAGGWLPFRDTYNAGLNC